MHFMEFAKGIHGRHTWKHTGLLPIHCPKSFEADFLQAWRHSWLTTTLKRLKNWSREVWRQTQTKTTQQHNWKLTLASVELQRNTVFITSFISQHLSSSSLSWQCKHIYLIYLGNVTQTLITPPRLFSQNQFLFSWKLWLCTCPRYTMSCFGQFPFTGFQQT